MTDHRDCIAMLACAIENGCAITDDDFMHAVNSNFPRSIRAMHKLGYIIREDILSSNDVKRSRARDLIHSLAIGTQQKL